MWEAVHALVLVMLVQVHGHDTFLFDNFPDNFQWGISGSEQFRWSGKNIETMKSCIY